MRLRAPPERLIRTWAEKMGVPQNEAKDISMRLPLRHMLGIHTAHVREHTRKIHMHMSLFRSGTRGAFIEHALSTKFTLQFSIHLCMPGRPGIFFSSVETLRDIYHLCKHIQWARFCMPGP